MAFAIRGIEGLSPAEVLNEVDRGGRFVVYSYALSFLIVTLRRRSDIHFLRAGEGAIGPSAPYTLVSLLFGWWGIPWGLIYTPAAIFENLSGGVDVTENLAGYLEQALAQGSWPPTDS